MTNGLSVSDITPLGERPADVWRGRTGTTGAGVFTIAGSAISASPTTTGDTLVYDSATDTWVIVNDSTFGVPLTVEDEGVALATSADTLNFVGAGVTATGTGGTKTITIPGGSSLEVDEDGVSVVAAATTLDARHGLDVTASGTTAEVAVDETELVHNSLSGLTTGDPHTQYALDSDVAAGYQPLDSDLTAIAALTTTSFGRALLTLADAAAGRSDLGLGSLAVLSSLAHSATTGQTVNDHHAQLHHAAHEPGGGDAMAVDAAAATGSLRTLGTGGTQAAAGNDSRLSGAISAGIADYILFRAGIR